LSAFAISKGRFFEEKNQQKWEKGKEKGIVNDVCPRKFTVLVCSPATIK
jgi:hypothetical protein